jgi:hypothetical protein
MTKYRSGEESIPEFEDRQSAPAAEAATHRGPSEHDRGVRNSEIRRETQTSGAMGKLPGTSGGGTGDD